MNLRIYTFTNGISTIRLFKLKHYFNPGQDFVRDLKCISSESTSIKITEDFIVVFFFSV